MLGANGNGTRGKEKKRTRARNSRGERRKERTRWMVGTSAFHDVGVQLVGDSAESSSGRARAFSKNQ